MNWIAWTRYYMEDHKMYTVFHVYDPYLKTEFYLLYYWGESNDGKVSKWVQKLTTMGVGEGTRNYLLVCNFD